MTHWRDSLQLEGKGSFRGVEFYVDSADSSIGRKTAVHEFPNKEKPAFIEDLGPSSKKFTLNAYIVGSYLIKEEGNILVENYITQRNKLSEAFSKEGPGQLVHPYWGNFTVSIVGDVSITESFNDGGVARFTLNMVETDAEVSPLEEEDLKDSIDSNADAVNASAIDALVAAWDTVVGKIENVRDSAAIVVNSAVSTLNSINGSVNAAMNSVDAVGDSINALGDQVTNLILLPAQLASTVQEIILDINSSIDQIGTAWDSYFGENEVAGAIAGTPLTSATAITPATGYQRANILMSTFRSLSEFGNDFQEVLGNSLQQVAKRNNQDAFVAFFKTVAASETCRVVANLPFNSFNQADSIKDELALQLDTLADEADDSTYAALMNLRVSVCRFLVSASADLPRVVYHTPKKTLPALVISQMLYGDSRKDYEIIERNNLKNPAKVSGGVELEVLSNE